MSDSNKRPDVSAAMIDGELVITFGDGSQVVVNQASMSAAIREQAMWHGLKQKLIDAAAIPRNTDTGRSATLSDKIAAVREVYDRLLAGEWNKAREGGGGGGGASDQTLLIEALCRMTPTMPRAKVVERVKAMSTGERNALMVHKAVSKFVDAIRTERAAGLDADPLLKDFLAQ